MRFYWLVLGILAVWRVTHLLNAEDGPADLLVRLRRWLGSGLLGSLLDCFYCLSLWIAAPFAYVLGTGWKEWVLLWLALSGAACLLERFASPERRIPPALYSEDQELNDVLRKEPSTISGNRHEPPAT